MQNKILKRLLLVAVPLIWGKYFWDLWANGQMESELENLTSGNELSFSPLGLDKDTFQLELPAWDPFLSESSQFNTPVETPESNNNSDQNKVKTVPEPKPEMTWPKIEYFGFVKNRDKDKTLCLLKIDGRNYKVSKGDIFNDLVIVGVYHDSVRVSFGGEFRTVGKG